MGDTYGRKPCLVATVSVMGVATVLIGCLPTFAMIGLAAPVLLALLRIVQGLAMGGEACPPRRGCEIFGLYGQACRARLGFAQALCGARSCISGPRPAGPVASIRV